MARLRCHGEVLFRMVKPDHLNYVFMSDGKVLKGISGRYNLVKLAHGKTIDDLRIWLEVKGFVKQQ